MKRKTDFLIVALFAIVLFTSCERVAPNYAGVLMENYGKQGKEDFKIVSGKVSTWELGTELFQVPLFDQRGEFAEAVTLKAADNTEFKARPTYSYKVIKNRAIDVVFDNKHIGRGSDFMSSLEDNILEPRIYDLIKEESRKHKTDSLMADGGSLVFEKRLEQKKRNELEQLKTEQALIQSRGLTKEILYKQFIDKWDGTSPLYGIAPEFLKITK